MQFFGDSRSHFESKFKCTQALQQHQPKKKFSKKKKFLKKFDLRLYNTRTFTKQFF